MWKKGNKYTSENLNTMNKNRWKIRKIKIVADIVGRKKWEKNSIVIIKNDLKGNQRRVYSTKWGSEDRN